MIRVQVETAPVAVIFILLVAGFPLHRLGRTRSVSRVRWIPTSTRWLY